MTKMGDARDWESPWSWHWGLFLSTRINLQDREYCVNTVRLERILRITVDYYLLRHYLDTIAKLRITNRLWQAPIVHLAFRVDQASFTVIVTHNSCCKPLITI